MTRLRHIGCKSEIIRYVGDIPLGSCSSMESKDWRWPDGSRVAVMGSRFVKCLDCGRDVLVHRSQLEEIPTIRSLVSGAKES